MKKIIEKIKNIKKKKEVKKDKNFVLNTFSDLAVVYKNFLNWNKNKIVIYLFWIIFWLVLSFPFLLIYKLVWWISFFEIYIKLVSWVSLNSFDSFFSNFIYLYKSFAYIIVLLLSSDFLNVLFLLGWVFLIFWLFYSIFILIKMSNFYLEWKKPSIKELDLLNFRKIVKFFNLTVLNLLILLLPIILFFVLTWILLLFSWDLSTLREIVASNSKNYFSILSLLFLIISIIFAVYLLFRIIFSYFILTDDFNKDKSAFKYIKESIIKTKWFNKFLKFLVLIFIWYFILLPFKYILFVLVMSWMTFNIITVLFTIITFLVVYSLIIMIFASFYKREIK